MFDVNELKDKVLDNYKVTKEDALNLIDVPLDDLTNAANEIRQSFCGNSFDACMLINVKSGRCSENCKFCAQSNHYNADIETYPLLTREELKEKSLAIYNAGFKRISYVASGRKVTNKDFETLSNLIGDLKESSRDYFKEICTTHSYDEKIGTLKLINDESVMICSGGIFGMGESFEDRIDLALQLREFGVKSIPINVLNPIKGTPVENNEILSNDEVCRIIAIFRFINPDAYIRMAGGRALLGDDGRKAFQSGANAGILGNMLTTDGVELEDDLRLLDDLGFQISYTIDGL